MALITENKPTLKAFKETCQAIIYGRQQSGLYHIYYGYDGKCRYKYRIKCFMATKDKAIRAAYYLLYGNPSELELQSVDTGEYKISLSFGDNQNSFYAKDYDANYFNNRMKLNQD